MQDAADATAPDDWTRPSRCHDSTTCAEVLIRGDAILLRHSDHPDRPPLAFTRAEWDAFLHGVRNEEFDPPGQASG